MNKHKQIHIGKLIKDVVSQKGIKTSWLAEQLGCHRNNIYLIYARSWIDTETLMQLCYILEYDFFASLSTYFQQQQMQSIYGQKAKI